MFVVYLFSFFAWFNSDGLSVPVAFYSGTSDVATCLTLV